MPPPHSFLRPPPPPLQAPAAFPQLFSFSFAQLLHRTKRELLLVGHHPAWHRLRSTRSPPPLFPPLLSPLLSPRARSPTKRIFSASQHLDGDSQVHRLSSVTQTPDHTSPLKFDATQHVGTVDGGFSHLSAAVSSRFARPILQFLSSLSPFSRRRDVCCCERAQRLAPSGCTRCED